MYTVIIGKYSRKSLKESGHDTELTEKVIEVCLYNYNCLHLSIIIKEEADVTALALNELTMYAYTNYKWICGLFYYLLLGWYLRILYNCLRLCIIKIKEEAGVTAFTLSMSCMHTLTTNNFYYIFLYVDT